MQDIYWQVNGVNTRSKGEALLLSGGDLSAIHFYFHDNEWKDKDYTVEPEKTFDQLAIERCNHLRGNSDWLALWLSSGYDSNTILDYFIASNCVIDEIIMFRRADWDPEYEWASARALHYKDNHNKNLKITYWQVPYQHHLEVYNTLKQDWVKSSAISGRFSKSSLTWNVETASTGMKALDQHSQNRIDVTGFDKPRVSLCQDKWHAMFPDTGVIDVYNERFTGFFIHTDAFELYLKSCYSVIRWFESLPNLTEDLVHRVQSHKVYYKEWNRACGRLTNVSGYSQNGFGKGMFDHSTSSNDSKKYIAQFKNTKTFEYYLEGLQSLVGNKDWWSPGEDIANKSMLCSNQMYIREKNG